MKADIRQFWPAWVGRLLLHLSDRERERLDIFTAAEFARRRLARGTLLSAPEAIAIVCDEILERAWDGENLAEIIDAARKVLTPDQLQPGVPTLVHHIQVDALFPSGTALVAVDRPFGQGSPQGPGAFKVLEGDIELNVGRSCVEVEVLNTSDLPIYVSSHFPFAEVNRGLQFDRALAQGFRLDIPAGTSTGFDPGERVLVRLVSLDRAVTEVEESS